MTNVIIHSFICFILRSLQDPRPKKDGTELAGPDMGSAADTEHGSSARRGHRTRLVPSPDSRQSFFWYYSTMHYALSKYNTNNSTPPTKVLQLPPAIVMASSFTDKSTECAICFETFEGTDTITLTCGHRWHTDCVKQQLQSAEPNTSQRLLFSGYRCAKCKEFCDHPELRHLTRKTDRLRERVDALVEEQLQADLPAAWEGARHDRDAKARLLDEGRRSYAFYLCGGCDEPYFGGTVECADEQQGELIASEDRICQACSPRTQEICQNPLEHGPYHVWKCRYCCNPATFLCYGNVHFCKPCHDRNPKNVHAIPCSGACCTFPKKEGQTSHLNGPQRECEQLYYCAWCESHSSRVGNIERSGSRNFIVNHSGEEGTRGWHSIRTRERYFSHHHHEMWRVENSEVRADPHTHTNFVSSFYWASMMQTVPLHQYVRDPSSIQIEVSSKFMGRTDCPSVFRMEALVTNSNGRIVHRVGTSELTAPPGVWERATLTIDPVADAHEVSMIVYGKDTRFWAGNFGSKVCHCSIRVLCEEGELENILVGE